jgi:hypothetical protein
LFSGWRERRKHKEEQAMNRTEPWRRFEAKVDPEGLLLAVERARRAKISYKAWLRANAQKSAEARLAKKHRREAALARRLAKPPTPAEMAAFAAERDAFLRSAIIWAAAQRGQTGIEDLARHQRRVRATCLLCGGPLDRDA